MYCCLDYHDCAYQFNTIDQALLYFLRKSLNLLNSLLLLGPLNCSSHDKEQEFLEFPHTTEMTWRRYMNGIRGLDGNNLTVMVVVIRDQLYENTIELLYPTLCFRLKVGWILVAARLVLTFFVKNSGEMKRWLLVFRCNATIVKLLNM